MSSIRSKISFGNMDVENSTKKTWMENQFLPSSSRFHFKSKGKEIKVPSYIPPSRPTEDTRPSTSNLSAFRRALSRVVGWFSWLSIVRCRNRKSGKSPSEEKCQKSNRRFEPSKFTTANVDIDHQAELGTPVQDSTWSRPTSDFTTVTDKSLALELKDFRSTKDQSTSSRRHTDTAVKSRKSKAHRKPSVLDPMTEGQVEHQEGVMYTKLQQNPAMDNYHLNVEKDKSKDFMGKDLQHSEDQPLPKKSMKKKRKSKSTERLHQSESVSTEPKVDHQTYKSKDLESSQHEQSLPQRRSKSLEARKSKNLGSSQSDQPVSTRRSKSMAKSRILESEQTDKPVPESLPSKEKSAEQAKKPKELGNGQRDKSLPERRSNSLQAPKSKNWESGQNDQPASARRSKSTAKSQILKPEESNSQVLESLPSKEKSARQSAESQDSGNRKMDLDSTGSDGSTTKSMILECESKSMQMPTKEVSEEKSLPQEPSTSADVAAEAYVSENSEGKVPDPKMEEVGTSATTSKPSPSQQKEFPKLLKKVQSKKTSPITMDSICLTEDEKYNASLVGAMIGNRASKQPFHLTYGEILSQIELPPQIPPEKDPEFEMHVDDAASKMVENILRDEKCMEPEPSDYILTDTECELEIAIDDVASEMVENVLKGENQISQEPLKQNQPKDDTVDAALDDVTMTFNQDPGERSDVEQLDKLEIKPIDTGSAQNQDEQQPELVLQEPKSPVQDEPFLKSENKSADDQSASNKALQDASVELPIPSEPLDMDKALPKPEILCEDKNASEQVLEEASPLQPLDTTEITSQKEESDCNSWNDSDAYDSDISDIPKSENVPRKVRKQKITGVDGSNISGISKLEATPKNMQKLDDSDDYDSDISDILKSEDATRKVRKQKLPGADASNIADVSKSKITSNKMPEKNLSDTDISDILKSEDSPKEMSKQNDAEKSFISRPKDTPQSLPEQERSDTDSLNISALNISDILKSEDSPKTLRKLNRSGTDIADDLKLEEKPKMLRKLHPKYHESPNKKSKPATERKKPEFEIPKGEATIIDILNDKKIMDEYEENEHAKVNRGQEDLSAWSCGNSESANADIDDQISELSRSELTSSEPMKYEENVDARFKTTSESSSANEANLVGLLGKQANEKKQTVNVDEFSGKKLKRALKEVREEKQKIERKESKDEKAFRKEQKRKEKKERKLIEINIKKQKEENRRIVKECLRAQDKEDKMQMKLEREKARKESKEAEMIRLRVAMWNLRRSSSTQDSKNDWLLRLRRGFALSSRSRGF